MDNIKLCGMLTMLERRDAIQRIFNRIEKKICTKLMFNKARCKALLGNLQHKYRLGREWIESSPEVKDLGILINGKLSMSWYFMVASQLHQQNCI